MTNQVQYTVELSISQGKMEEFRRIIQSFLEAIQNREPDTNAFQIYLNEDESKAYLVEWFKSSEAILAHFDNVGPMLPELLAIAPITRLEVFGNLTKEAEEAVKSLGATVLHYHAGFIRGDISA
ncbi:MAG: antibiotic biosynthesis monooxygenase [Bacteroidota bacterium]|nr:antibiotic biosynthesis monooxygenase [Bacteroidota bacterium]